MNDLFHSAGRLAASYSAKDIEVLEGLEPVRRRPGMYIGGTDDRAFHHLAAEVLDNAIDEVVAGFASRIEVTLGSDGLLAIADNGRGIPVDRHPKFKDKSALEVILTTLHSGGKFSGKVYKTSGGLHGVGLSVVNALSDRLTIEVARDQARWTQTYERGRPTGKLNKEGPAGNKHGTTVTFHPDPQIFGDKAHFDPARLFAMVRAKAYLVRGVEIRWHWPDGAKSAAAPEKAVLHFPGGLGDFLAAELEGRATVTPAPFVGRAEFPDGKGSVEWAIAWPEDGEGGISSYCNTIPTPEGGTHEAGLRAGLSRGLKAYGELVGNRRAAQIAPDDVLGAAKALLSVFIPEPQFQGQTKERLASADTTRLVEAVAKDHFDHWLSGAPASANALLSAIIERAEERLKRREQRDIGRKSATRKLRLPGKLSDCTRDAAAGTEIFLVEGDSAGGSAKQARDRATQAVLPLRGKILNVAQAASGKLSGNQELSDLVQALGCGMGERFREQDLRYERVIIMTDADVDGAHIASLLMTFFYREMRPLVAAGHLYLAAPPLYRLSRGGTVAYARDDRHKDELLRTTFAKGSKVEIGRFKGLGEMMPAQLKETTMQPGKRSLYRVVLPQDRESLAATDLRVESLMGRKPELRLAFIQENAPTVENLDV